MPRVNSVESLQTALQTAINRAVLLERSVPAALDLYSITSVLHESLFHRTYEHFRFSSNQVDQMLQLGQQCPCLLPSILTILTANQHSQHRSDLLSNSVITPDTAFVVHPWIRGGWICNAAEDKLADSINQKNAILINNDLVYKREGVRAALALRNIVTNRGVLLQGHWYRCVDPKLRRELNETTERSLLLKKAKWAIFRPICLSEEGVLPEETFYIATAFRYSLLSGNDLRI